MMVTDFDPKLLKLRLGSFWSAATDALVRYMKYEKYFTC